MTAPLGWGLCGVLVVTLALGSWAERRRGLLAPLVLVPLAVLAAVATGRVPVGTAGAPLVAALVIALLARQRDDLLHSECALKLLWVLAPAFALSALGVALLDVTTSTTIVHEQWSVLAMELEPSMLWTTALALSLLVGAVLLGGAPFHFWTADLVQGARPWIAAPATAALQTCGAAWLAHRLDGIEQLPEAAATAHLLLGIAAGVAFAVGAVTVATQRRPERRVGTLASLNGALVLGALASGPAGRSLTGSIPGALWSAHLALALLGASTLSRFVPVRQTRPASAPVLFRRHPAWGAVGLFAMASLAGVPGTPGAVLWLAVGKALVAASRTTPAVLLGIAWLASVSMVVRQALDAFGIVTAEPVPPRGVPASARWAMLSAGAGLLVLGAAMVWTRRAV